MWSLIGKYALRIALYAYGHPDVVKQVIDTIGVVKGAVEEVKQ